MIRADYLINLVLEDISMAVIDCEFNNLNQEQKGKKNCNLFIINLIRRVIVCIMVKFI